ncbi:hypothetical protein [Rickettsia asembonensis]|uniref:hypothetical protein n=1 Tax=Rickettsia asembonensis TaxID=1068590 RepID=UPI0019D7083B|nr:hypothetical protein [Rickettsia asembonensis]
MFLFFPSTTYYVIPVEMLPAWINFFSSLRGGFVAWTGFLLSSRELLAGSS